MRSSKINVINKILRIGVIASMLLSMSLYAVETVRIMPLGDSITEGGSNGNSDPANSNTFIAYRGQLWTKLHDAGYTMDFVGGNDGGEDYRDNNDSTFDVNHEGHDGWKADEIDAQVTGFLNTNPADVVLLHIGTNDLNDGESIASTVTDVENILNKIKANNSNPSVIIARIINRETYDADTTTFNNDLNTMVQNRISNGDDIMIVDMENGADINYTADMKDNLHPNETGYGKMADLWLSALKTVIPIHVWTLDETASPYIDIFRDANGTCTGADCPTAITDGQIDGAQSFDGTNEINVTDTATFNWSADDSFTISLWMKTDTDQANNLNNIMIGQRSNTGGAELAWFIGVEKGSGKVVFGLNDSDDSGYTTLTGDSAVVNNNQWHHIACVRDGDNNTTKIYVDGVLDHTDTTEYNAPFNTGNQPVTIGNLDFGNYTYYGSLDEIAVFDGALNDAQIKRLYQDAQTPVLSITTTPVTSAQLNTPYSYDVNSSQDPLATFDWTGGISPANWMSINADGEITGTPDTVANIDVNITATKDAETATQDYILKVRNPANLPADMGYYWKLDEATGETTYLDSYQGADGVCAAVGCPTQITGQIDTAQNFTGTQGIDVTDTTGLNLPAGASFTIEMWVKTNTDTVDGQNNVMIGRADPSKLSWFIAANKNNDGKILFGLFDSNDGTPSSAQVDGNVSVTNDQWHHIACVRDGSNDRNMIYVDGILSGEKSVSYDVGFEQGTLPLTIGYLNWNSFEYEGSLDEIALFDVALSQAEIQQHYNNGVAGKGFELDTTAPTLTEVTVVPTPTNDTTPDYTFSSDEDGTITYGGDCTSAMTDATAGNNTVIFNALAAGTHSNCTIKVTDAAGNESQVLNITEFMIDTTPPAITLTGANPQTIEVGTAYTELGATANDNVDGDITANIVIDVSAVDTSTVGSYTVTYDVNDTAGNVATQVTRTVSVVDITAPVITLIGDATVNLLVGETYTEQGASCTDNYDTTCSVTIGGDTVDTSTVGTYTVTYDANDTAGNAATQVTRTVNVTAGNAPVITLTGDNPYIVEVHTTYTDPGATATDAEDGSVSVTNDSATSVNMTVVGDYTVTYTATDSQNNTVHTTRTVSVVDTTAPVIALTGDATVNLLVGETYTEQGASCTDNYDTTCSVTIGGDTVDTSTVGTYTVTYDANDTAGNAATQVTRTVNVTNAATDTDGDGIPDATDTDDDNDGVADTDDAFPLDASESVDTDKDGIGNNADTDDDGDGVADTDDAFPLDVNESVDTDKDGIGDNADMDDDNDGILDDADADVDGDGTIDNGTDSDGNGLNDENDHDWFTYEGDDNIKTVTVTPTGSTEHSVIVAEDGDATVVPAADSIILKVQNANGCTAYVKALDNGTVTTGYQGATCQNAGDTINGAFPAGTRSVITQGGTSIESTVELNMNESFIIGGK